MEAELIMNYEFHDELSAPLVLDGPNLAARQQDYRDAFRVYRTEPVPSSGIRLAEAGSGMVGVAFGNMSAPGDVGCDHPLARDAAGLLDDPACEVTLRNHIVHTTVVPNAEAEGHISVADGRTGDVKTKFCDCPEAGNDSFQHRFRCRSAPYNCFPDADRFEARPLTWIRVDTVPWDSYDHRLDPNWNTPATFDPTYTYAFQQDNQAADLLWDFSQVGRGCVDPDNSGAHHCEHGLPSVQGVLWNDLRFMAGLVDDTGTTVPTRDVRWRGGSFWSGVGGYDVRISGKLHGAMSFLPDVLFPCEFLGCGDAFDAGEIISYPSDFRELAEFGYVFDPAETLAGFGGVYERSGRTLSEEVALTFAYVQDSEARIALTTESTVDIGKPSERLELRGLAMEGDQLAASSILLWDTRTRTLKSAALPGMSGSYLEVFGRFANERKELQAIASDGEIGRTLHALSVEPSGDVPERFHSDQGFVLSGSTLQAFVIGGSNNLNRPRRNARIWNLETNSWTKVHLDFGARIGEVQAAAFNPHDGYVYAWDVHPRTGNMRIKRWDPGTSRFELVARLSSLWKDFDQHWLSVGRDGSLAIVGTRNGRTAVGRIDLGGDGQLAFAGVSTLDARVAGRPVVTPTRVIVGVADEFDRVHTPLHADQFELDSDWKFRVVCD